MSPQIILGVCCVMSRGKGIDIHNSVATLTHEGTRYKLWLDARPEKTLYYLVARGGISVRLQNRRLGFESPGQKIMMIFVGSILVAIGIIALLIKLGVLSGSLWGYTWPIILIILGLTFLWGRFSRRGRGWRGWCFPRENEKKQ